MGGALGRFRSSVPRVPIGDRAVGSRGTSGSRLGGHRKRKKASAAEKSVRSPTYKTMDCTGIKYRVTTLQVRSGQVRHDVAIRIPAGLALLSWASLGNDWKPLDLLSTVLRDLDEVMCFAQRCASFWDAFGRAYRSSYFVLVTRLGFFIW